MPITHLYDQSRGIRECLTVGCVVGFIKCIQHPLARTFVEQNHSITTNLVPLKYSNESQEIFDHQSQHMA